MALEPLVLLLVVLAVMALVVPLLEPLAVELPQAHNNLNTEHTVELKAVESPPW